MTKIPQLTRRDTLMLAGAATLMTPASKDAKAAAPRSPVVLVHGAWHGGWCWDRVRPHLEAAGVRVLAPTLTELGERAHLNQPVPSLDTHIEDIARLIGWEELRDVVLVGHSLGGMIISAVADRLKQRIRHLVYLDAAVPADGDDFASQIPGINDADADRRRRAFRTMASDGVWLPVPDPAILGVTEATDVAWLKRRMTPHPLQTWLDPVRYRNGGPAGLPKTYVLATQPPTTVIGYPLHGEIARRGGEWTYREISCGHDMMVVEPRRTAELILEAC
jgi:pimeloyl-ACP methyl ester carboxylesterase